MDISKLSEPLEDSDIELRVGTVGANYGNKHKMTLLAYKTARVDVTRLNDVVGPLNWQNEYFYDQKGYLCCKIGIFNPETKDWVWKEDVGTESQTEKEKGSYSDAMKRAGYKWGIGIELYKITNLFVNLDPKDVTKKESGNKTVYNYKYASVVKQWKIKTVENGYEVYNNFGNKIYPVKDGKTPIEPKGNIDTPKPELEEIITPEEAAILRGIISVKKLDKAAILTYYSKKYGCSIKTLSQIPKRSYGDILEKLKSK